MHAALIRRYGPPEVLGLGEVPLPQPAEGEVLVRVVASSVNPVDCYLRRGGLRRFAHLPFPIVPGVDISGVVEKCGPNVRNFQLGEKVLAFLPRGMGACAEFAVADASWICRKPGMLSHTQAGVLPCVGLTALQGLRDKAGLKAGQSVMIVGASGGVGSMAVQIARVMKATVTAVCSTTNVELVRKLGAVQVIDYTRENPVHGSAQFDAIFDCVGERTFWDWRKRLKAGGRHVGIAGTRAAMMHALFSHLTPGRKSSQFHVEAISRDLEQLAAWIEQGKIQPLVSHVYQLGEIAAAHRQCETRRTTGKIAVAIA